MAAKQSSCELEVDIVAADILNRLEVGGQFTLSSTSRCTNVSLSQKRIYHVFLTKLNTGKLFYNQSKLVPLIQLCLPLRVFCPILGLTLINSN